MPSIGITIAKRCNMFHGSSRIVILTLFMGLLGLLGSSARSQPATNTTVDSTDPADQHVWELNDYLKGTAPKIRDEVNGELERLTAKQKDLRHRCSGYDAAILAEQAAATNAAHNSDKYLKLAVEKKHAEADLKTARESGTAQEKLDASSNFNRIRQAMDKMVTDAVANDAKIPQLLKDKKEDQQELKQCEDAVATAQKWRDKLISALRDTFKMKWPLTPGAAGVLGVVTPLDDPSANGVTVEYEAYEPIETGGTQEGITTIRAVFHKVRLHLTGIDTKGMGKGVPVAQDRNFTIVGRPRGDEFDRTYEARPARDDLDRLFELLIPLRDVPPAAR
jgi:hypothetical protein